MFSGLHARLRHAADIRGRGCAVNFTGRNFGPLLRACAASVAGELRPVRSGLAAPMPLPSVRRGAPAPAAVAMPKLRSAARIGGDLWHVPRRAAHVRRRDRGLRLRLSRRCAHPEIQVRARSHARAGPRPASRKHALRRSRRSSRHAARCRASARPRLQPGAGARSRCRPHPGRAASSHGPAARSSETPPQAGLPWKERAANVRGSFVCDADLRGQRVAIVDDVMTTGATVGELARVLKRAGRSPVRRMSGDVLARTLR